MNAVARTLTILFLAQTFLALHLQAQVTYNPWLGETLCKAD
jgi:hypothetical protein